jgi:hypothetical protein
VEAWLTTGTLAGICGVLILLFLVILIWNLILSIKFSGLKKRFKRLSTGTSKENLEQILEKLFDRMDSLTESHAYIDEEVKRIRSSVLNRKGHFGMVRFQAFQNEGSDLSFSIALLDDERSGVVVTSIYGRSESRTYAKPIQNGTSPYHLSDEEKEAMNMAIKTIGIGN